MSEVKDEEMLEYAKFNMVIIPVPNLMAFQMSGSFSLERSMHLA